MIKQNPFSLYDFFGYFIPGALVIFITLLLLKITDFNNIDQLTVIVNNDKTFQFENLLFFVIISYSTGHLINFSSSITIEKYANWKYDYPSKYLMGLKPDHAFLSGSKRVILWKLLLVIFLFPVTILDLILGEFLRFKIFYTKKMDNLMIEFIKSKASSLLNQLGCPKTKRLRNYDFHRILAHYVYENSKNHQSRISNYVALYGFLRSLCLISVLFVWLILKRLYVKIYLSESISLYFEKNKYLLIYFVVITIVSYIFFMAFMKFYRRYTLENLMLIAIDKNLEVPENRRNYID